MNQCSMIKPQVPSVLLVYICVRDNPMLVSHASHFIDSYRCHPPGFEHKLLVICNGGALSAKNKSIFDVVPHEMFVRNNDPGWDISAYIYVAQRWSSTLQVCLGESVYFRRSGWLSQVVDCFSKHGPGMYGFFSSYLVRPHLNTTAFAVSPEYLRDYPPPVDQRTRYAFEHGPQALWRRITNKGGVAKLVTWDGCYDPKDWRKPDNILWRGDQSNSLMMCNHLDRFDAASPDTKMRWSKSADGLNK